ncbi:hypothetical protein [Bacillus sp. FJAT-45037]|uniref:hypothetical protein n=1 Tax=Bacillus sp. FJAT-45037 TaxID=2011007 RepID=UPI000C2403B4|nr:hypothetical protein [Bacillus sp. FJAT-45037]
MSEGKMIRQLLWFELKSTPVFKYLLTFFAIAVIVFLTNNLAVDITSESRLPVFYDIMFISAICVPIFILRYKPFTISDLKGGLYASSFFILLKQTPISDKVIRKSRFIMTGIYTFALNSLLFLLLYFYSTPFQQWLSGTEAIVLWISWLAISYLMGGSFAAGEPGQVYTTTYLVVFTVVFYGIVIGILTGFNIVFGMPIVAWTIIMAQSQPLLLLLISLATLVISTLILLNEYNRYIKSVDYRM